MTEEQRREGIGKTARELQQIRKGSGMTGPATSFEACRDRVRSAVKAGDLKRQEK